MSTTKKSPPKDYSVELLKEIQKVDGTNINVRELDQSWIVTYDLPYDEHVEIKASSLEIIAKAMLFMRLAVEFKKLIIMKKTVKA